MFPYSKCSTTADSSKAGAAGEAAGKPELRSRQRSAKHQKRKKVIDVSQFPSVTYLNRYPKNTWSTTGKYMGTTGKYIDNGKP